MTTSYKIALAAAGLLLLVVVASLFMQNTPAPADGEATPSEDPTTAGASEAPESPESPPGPVASRPGAGTDPTHIRFTDPQLDRLPEPAAEAYPSLSVGRSPFGESGSIFADDFPPPPVREETPAPSADDDTIAASPSPDAAPAEDAGPPATPGLALGPVDTPATLDAETGTVSPPAQITVSSTEPPVLRRYTVEAGDSLSSIALTVYGSANRWVEIAQANPLVDPNRLRVGQEIKLPDLRGGAVAAAPGEAGEDLPRRGATYTVKAGDTLSSIAKQYYNSASKWELLYQANRRAIGDDPGNVRVGMELLIPPPASGAN
jgi:nucleoid-associated protein YgaU